MNDTQKALVRYIFQHALSTQHPENYEMLRDRFLEAACDEEQAREYMEAWQQFEGWIAGHGLERAR